MGQAERKAFREGDGFFEMQRKEKLLSTGVYILIIIITVALMLILFNLIIMG
jgi:hypothetical protein